ncbi:TPA: fimbrial protein [Citrobacter freundii]|nr:fimbrial protein [Citrobacter amalonaticus]HAT6802661.1 fimbrial protein [Citrobacter freundii]HAU5067915.1 fimbrial protein [Citrobacter amalonaticus]
MTANKRIVNGVVRYSSHGIILVVMALLLSILPRDASAKYTTSCVKGSDLLITPGNIVITPDDTSAYPVGSLIGGPYSASVTAFTFTGQQCSVGSGSSTWAESSGNPAVGTYTAPEGNLPVYSLTGVPGIGLAMAVADPNNPWQGLQQNPTKALWADNHAIWYGVLGVRYKLYIVTTGSLTTGNFTLPKTNFGKICLSSSQTSDTHDICPSVGYNAFTISIKPGGCDINPETPSTIHLNRINANELPKKGDVGKNVTFNLSLKCNAATTITMTLTDPNGGDPANGVVFNDTGDGLAQHVGVQVLSARDGSTTPQTVHLNESFTVGQANEGQYTIPMAARYYRTSDEAIVGGKISASVIYELSYQ